MASAKGNLGPSVGFSIRPARTCWCQSGDGYRDGSRDKSRHNISNTSSFSLSVKPLMIDSIDIGLSCVHFSPPATKKQSHKFACQTLPQKMVRGTNATDHRVAMIDDPFQNAHQSPLRCIRLLWPQWRRRVGVLVVVHYGGLKFNFKPTVQQG